MRVQNFLLRVGLLAVALGGFYVYDRFIAKPRILSTAPEAVLAKGWTKYEDPGKKFSVGVPPGFVILDPSRMDYKEALAKLRKSDPESAKHLESYADRTPPPGGFAALNPFSVAGGKPYIGYYRMWVEQAPRMIRNDDKALSEMGAAFAKDNPGLTFAPVRKVKTPATDAFVWTGSGAGVAGLPTRISEIAFLDKFDAFYVEMDEMPGDADHPDLWDQIAQSFREYQPDTGWDNNG